MTNSPSSTSPIQDHQPQPQQQQQNQQQNQQQQHQQQHQQQCEDSRAGAPSSQAGRDDSPTQPELELEPDSGNGSGQDALAAAELRRNLFLEERRSRLREHLSHGELVRERARQEGAQQRSSIESTLVERLRQAERNRLELLQRQVQQCTAAVEHARHVAREVQVTRDEQIAQRRIRIDERLQAQGMRREQHLQVIASPKLRVSAPSDANVDVSALASGRYSSDGSDDSDGSDGSYGSDSNAARTIQRVWRQRSLAPVVRQYVAANVSRAQFSSSNFAACAQHVRRPAVLAAAAAMISRLVRLGNQAGRGSADTDQDDGRVSPSQFSNTARVFLTGYLCTAFPEDVLGERSELDVRLEADASQMCNAMDEFVSRFLSVGARWFDEAVGFVSTWTAFYTTFGEWKDQDRRRTIALLTSHYLELDRLWQSVRYHVDAETEWRGTIHAQRQAIEQQIARLGDQAALDELHEAQLQARRDYDVSSIASPSEAMPSFDQASAQIRLSDSVMGPASDTDAADAANLDGDLASYMSTAQLPAPLVEFVHNEQLVHELIVDPSFQLARTPLGSLHDIVRTTMRRAFFDKVAEDIGSGKSQWIPQLVRDVREALLSVAPPSMSSSSALAEEIQAALDEDLAAQLASTGNFQLAPVLEFVVGKMLGWCAPARDEEIRAIDTSAADIARGIGSVERVLDILELMRMDMLNYELQRLRPLLATHAVGIESEHFQTALGNSQIGLTRTRLWLAHAVGRAQERAQQRNPVGSSPPVPRIRVAVRAGVNPAANTRASGATTVNAAQTDGMRFEHIYADALIQLVFSTEAISLDSCPETLLLDCHRLFALQNEIQAVIITTVVIHMARTLYAPLQQQSAAGAKALRDSIVAILQRPSPSVAAIAEAVQLAMQNTQAAQSSHAAAPVPSITLVSSMVSRVLSVRDSFYRLVSGRLEAALTQVLKGMRHDANMEQFLGSLGFTSTSDNVLSIAERLQRLSRHNRAVHATRYNEILSSLLN